MSDQVLVTRSYLENTGDAIREKLDNDLAYTPAEFGAAIRSIEGGITPTGTIQIEANGTHDVTEYADANVNVQPNLQSKTVNQNGTVTPDQGYDGLSSVVVNVSGADRSLMNYAFFSNSVNDPPIVLNDWAGPFKSRYTFIRPVDANGSILKPNWSNPFEIKVQFKISQSMGRSMVLFGGEQGFYNCPSIEVSSDSQGLWCGLSSNGSSWTSDISFNSSDGISINTNTTMYVVATWDGTDYTVTFCDGTNTVTKTVTPASAPYYNRSYNIEFGGINKSTNHYAQYVQIDLLHTYIKQNNVMIWGCDAL